MSVITVTLKNGNVRYVGTYGFRGTRKRFDTREEAEAFAALSKRKVAPPIKNSWFGWQYWVVPAPPLRKILEDNKEYIEAADSDGLGNGWRELLAHRVALVLRSSPEAAKRRIYDLCYDKSRVITANYAEAICMTLGIDLDRDTDIPTLPGNRKFAAELIRCRADTELDELTLQRLANQTVRLSALIVKYPHNQARLQDMAPFDCLRPPK